MKGLSLGCGDLGYMFGIGVKGTRDEVVDLRRVDVWEPLDRSFQHIVNAVVLRLRIVFSFLYECEGVSDIASSIDFVAWLDVDDFVLDEGWLHVGSLPAGEGVLEGLEGVGGLHGWGGLVWMDWGAWVFIGWLLTVGERLWLLAVGEGSWLLAVGEGSWLLAVGEGTHENAFIEAAIYRGCHL